jgi:hypothetical protein
VARTGGCLSRSVCCGPVVVQLFVLHSHSMSGARQVEDLGSRMLGTNGLAKDTSSDTVTSLWAPRGLGLLLCPLIITTSDEIISSGQSIM